MSGVLFLNKQASRSKCCKQSAARLDGKRRRSSSCLATVAPVATCSHSLGCVSESRHFELAALSSPLGARRLEARSELQIELQIGSQIVCLARAESRSAKCGTQLIIHQPDAPLLCWPDEWADRLLSADCCPQSADCNSRGRLGLRLLACLFVALSP